MEAQEKDRIYDRLYTISMRMEPSSIPDPKFINEKIGQCHIFIEEVERFYIQISKEISIIQRALNNSVAAFEQARDRLISNDDEIKALPSLRDREARANSILHAELMEIKSYQNEVSDLGMLLKAVNLKNRNLTRLNSDIKSQIKLMESQIKLGTPEVSNSSVRSLMEELNKSTVGLDSFEGMETESEETNVQDPTQPLNVNDLLKLPGETNVGEDIIPDKLIEPTYTPGPEEEPELEEPQPAEPEEDILSYISDKIDSEEVKQGSVVDLDKMLEPEPKTIAGGEAPKIVPDESIQKQTQQAKNLNEISVVVPETPPEKIPAKSGELDLESLLSQFN